MSQSQPSNLRACAVVVAGGTGSRMGADRPKQFLTLAGEPVLIHCLRAFDDHPAITGICVVAAAEYHAMIRMEEPWTGLSKPLMLAEPGPERRDSVRNGLAAVRDQCDAVLIHDAARPLVTEAMIDSLLAEVAHGRGAIIAQPVADTLKREGSEGTIAETVDRVGLWRAETPQAFPLSLIWRAHEAAKRDDVLVTDDAQAVERLGEGRVTLVASATPNLKITHPGDLILAEALLRTQRKETRA